LRPEDCDLGNGWRSAAGQSQQWHAAACFWRAGVEGGANAIFNDLSPAELSRADEIQEAIDDLKAA